MPNIATALRDEIARVARKELRQELEPLQKSVTRYRGEIAALKRRLSAAESAQRKIARGARTSAESSADVSAEALRFRVDGLVSHRKRLGLSAADFGRLVGVSGQTIYAWESGKSRPRRSQLEAIAAARRLGKREAAERLAA